MVTQPELTRVIYNQYVGCLLVMYDQVLWQWKISHDKADTLWNINLNIPARSMKGILMLLEELVVTFQRNIEAFYKGRGNN